MNKNGSFRLNSNLKLTESLPVNARALRTSAVQPHIFQGYHNDVTLGHIASYQ